MSGMNTYYSPVFLAGALTVVLAFALFEAVKERPLNKKEIAIIAIALWGGICMTVALVSIFGLTLDIVQLTMDSESIPCDDQLILGVLRLILPPLF